MHCAAALRSAMPRSAVCIEAGASKSVRVAPRRLPGVARLSFLRRRRPRPFRASRPPRPHRHLRRTPPPRSDCHVRSNGQEYGENARDPIQPQSHHHAGPDQNGSLRLKREQLEILREKKGHTSPSSCPPSPNGPRASAFSNNLRAIPAHPLHPKAPEIRRPPAPLDPNLYPGHPDWPTPAEFRNTPPDPNEPPEPDAGPDGPYAPAPASSIGAPEPREMNPSIPGITPPIAP